MKKLYNLIALFLLQSGAFGQVINFPDANFKAKLLSATTTNNVAYTGDQQAVVIDSNGDGEIEVSEAAIINQLFVDNANIGSLAGLENFTGLVTLYCHHNNLTSINLAGLPLLEGLECSYNQLTSLNLSNFPSSFNLSCSYNQLQELVMPNANSNMNLECSHNQLTAIDLSRISAISVFDVTFNNLTSLSFNNPNHTLVGDQFMNVSNNPLTQLDFSALRPIAPGAELGGLAINNTSLTELTLPNVYINDLEIKGNPNLQYLNLRNDGGYLVTDFSLDNCLSCFMQITNNPELHLICVDEDETYNTLLTQLDNQNVNLTSYCSFTPNGNYNTVTGTVKLDNNSNGCDASDAAFAHLPIKIMQGNDLIGTVFTNSNGNYTGYNTQNPNRKYQPQFDNPYYTVSPASYLTTFTGYGNTENVDFCITPNGTHNDVQITIVPMTNIRPGFDARYRIVYKNKGTTTLSGNVSFYYYDRFQYVTASPAPVVNNTTLSWAYTDLLPLEERQIVVTLNANTPMNPNPVLIGQQNEFWATITPTVGDENDFDNNATLSQIAVGSFDPNDKAVSKMVTYYELFPNEYLDYTVRFQNTGTAAAENVVVKDMLDEKLDLSSLQIVSTSHNCRTVLNGQKLEFIFEGINLPDSTADEPASHGYVAFKIKPLPSLLPNNVITNEANIYFDFNFPILTNPVSTLVDTFLATAAFNPKDSFAVYPNPVNKMLQLKVSATTHIQAIKIYNTLGQLILSVPQIDFGMTTAIDVTALTAGTYFIEMVSDKGKSTQKIIKY
jgi:uncharacterized repeat protein (TIGR01451 family)